MNEKNSENRKHIVYAEHKERVFTGTEKTLVQDEVILQLKDLVSCLNFCDYELEKVKNKISNKIHELDMNKRKD